MYFDRSQSSLWKIVDFPHRLLCSLEPVVIDPLRRGRFLEKLFFFLLYVGIDRNHRRRQTAVGSKDNGCCIWAELSLESFRVNSAQLKAKLRIVQLRYPYTCRAVQSVECYFESQLCFYSNIEPSPAPVPLLRIVSNPYTKPLRSYPKRLNHGLQQQPSRCLTAFPTTHVLNHSSSRRRRHPLLSGGTSQLQQGHTVLSTSEDERVRQTVPGRPVDFPTLARRHHTQYLSSSAQETAGSPAIWGTARLSPSQISSGRLHE